MQSLSFSDEQWIKRKAASKNSFFLLYFLEAVYGKFFLVAFPLKGGFKPIFSPKVLSLDLPSFSSVANFFLTVLGELCV
jgi:hypothetical protein